MFCNNTKDGETLRSNISYTRRFCSYGVFCFALLCFLVCIFFSLFFFLLCCILVGGFFSFCFSFKCIYIYIYIYIYILRYQLYKIIMLHYQVYNNVYILHNNVALSSVIQCVYTT